jgi:hypothetical protein
MKMDIIIRRTLAYEHGEMVAAIGERVTIDKAFFCDSRRRQEISNGQSFNIEKSTEQ